MRKYLFAAILALLLPLSANADLDCTGDILARVVITKFTNVGVGADMTDDVYVGQSGTPISSGDWFPLYTAGTYINDPVLSDYNDVPGLAVQRSEGNVLVSIYGYHAGSSVSEHVEGYIEFSNGVVTAIRNHTDPTGHGMMENWGLLMWPQRGGADKDAALLAGGKSYFWMTVTTGYDSYYTDYTRPASCGAPKCDNAAASTPIIWPPNHKKIAEKIVGVTDPQNDSLTIVVTGILQDEPVKDPGSGNTSPDAGLSPLWARAERAGTSNGRVYDVAFTANDGNGNLCTGVVKICVPHNNSGEECVEDVTKYDSTAP